MNLSRISNPVPRTKEPTHEASHFSLGVWGSMESLGRSEAAQFNIVCLQFPEIEEPKTHNIQ